MLEPVNSASDAIDALGGITAVGRLVGRQPKVVWNWRRRGFPPETFLVLSAALKDKGREAPASLWGMQEAVAS